jgi:hypothetical protein
MRVSCADAAELFPLETCADVLSCARAAEHKSKSADTVTAFFMTLPLSDFREMRSRGQRMLLEVGGARGEMALGMSVDKASRAPGLSNRWETGATTSNSASVAIAEVVALQTGQKCEEAGAALTSLQK